MFSEFRITGERSGEMARQVGQYRLEGRLRRTRQSYPGWALAMLTRVPRSEWLMPRRGIEPRGA